jgi:hypothetical protein
VKQFTYLCVGILLMLLVYSLPLVSQEAQSPQPDKQVTQGGSPSGDSTAKQSSATEVGAGAVTMEESAPPVFDPSSVKLPEDMSLIDLPNDTGTTLALLCKAGTYDPATASHFIVLITGTQKIKDENLKDKTVELSIVYNLADIFKGSKMDSPQYYWFFKDNLDWDWFTIDSEDSENPFKAGQELQVKVGVVPPELEQESTAAKDLFDNAKKVSTALIAAQYTLDVELQKKKRQWLIDKYQADLTEKQKAFDDFGVKLEDAQTAYNNTFAKAYYYPQLAFTGKTSSSWYNPVKTNNIALAAILGIVVFWFIARARKDKTLFIRKINGLDAVDEAIGRATEMGKPILYLNGMTSLADLATLAALNILGEVSKKIAEYESGLLVPCRDPVVMTVAQEIVKGGFTEAGRPDRYHEDDIFFVTDDQFAYTASVNGIMLRDKPAANFFMGYYYAESLLLAETGAMTGAIQIAGTDSLAQLPFFIAACDYTLIGEELYAASAYLSREPLLLGSLKGQDIGKIFLMVVIILGTILATIGVVTHEDNLNFIQNIFQAL